MAAFGVLGLGTMGSNLAENVEEKGTSVAVWNLEPEWTDAFLARNAGKRFTGTKSLQEFVGALERPRRILIMIKAGKPVDQVLERLGPLLDDGDVVIDGGNSWFEETRRREESCREAGFHFVGMGVSGGEEGARHGPSLMPGGSPHAWEQLRPILESIAAKTEAGPCVTHVGPDGAGHFVKMVHNGIEYGDMQLLAEAYDVMRRALGMSVDETAAVFAAWNAGPLESFLVEITAKILTVQVDDGEPLVEKVLDRAGQKGTGRWTASLALELGVAVPTIAAAVDARILSSLKDERVAAAKKLRGPTKKQASGKPELLLEALAEAFWLGRVCAYAQGMELIEAGSREYRWKIDRAEVARIWKGGCIIRSALLETLRSAFGTRRPPKNLLVAKDVVKGSRKAHRSLRKIVRAATEMGVPIPAFSASLAYWDSYRTADLPQNLTQAQRDAFGAHTYVRKDGDGAGSGESVHTDWLD
ncbi:MAG: NADP-dependent phosphogluconate dehydrogenase [Planctomycetota bacterium JB042]